MDEVEVDLDKVELALDIISDEFLEHDLHNAEVFQALGLLLVHLIRTSAVDKNPEASLQLLREFVYLELQEKLDS
jgi:hypothetical protein